MTDHRTPARRLADLIGPDNAKAAIEDSTRAIRAINVGDTGPAVHPGVADHIAAIAILNALPHAAGALTEAKARAKEWHEKYANAQQALRSLTQAHADETAATDAETTDKAQPSSATGHRPSYVALVAALRAEFAPTGLEALWIQMRDHRENRSSLGVLAQATHDAQDLTYNPGEDVHPAVRDWFSRNTPSGAEATR